MPNNEVERSYRGTRSEVLCKVVFRAEIGGKNVTADGIDRNIKDSGPGL